MIQDLRYWKPEIRRRLAGLRSEPTCEATSPKACSANRWRGNASHEKIG